MNAITNTPTARDLVKKFQHNPEHVRKSMIEVQSSETRYIKGTIDVVGLLQQLDEFLPLLVKGDLSEILYGTGDMLYDDALVIRFFTVHGQMSYQLRNINALGQEHSSEYFEYAFTTYEDVKRAVMTRVQIHHRPVGNAKIRAYMANVKPKAMLVFYGKVCESENAVC